MSKLTTKERNALPKSQFAGPGNSYPIPDRSHAINAKARAAEMHNKGKLSLAQQKAIDAKANKVIARGNK
jgi:hypothetical protein